MKTKTYSILALICSIWFVLFGWAWTYFANVLLVFPIAVIGFVFWRKSKPEKKNALYTITGALFVIGLIVSAVAIFLYR